MKNKLQEISELQSRIKHLEWLNEKLLTTLEQYESVLNVRMNKENQLRVVYKNTN